MYEETLLNSAAGLITICNINEECDEFFEKLKPISRQERK
jgi:hypothetical protein